MVARTSEAVEVFTPPPSPIVTSPELIPEYMLRCIRDYFESSFASGTWISTEPKVECGSIKDKTNTGDNWNDLVTECGLVCSLITRKLPREAIQTLRIITGRIQQILLAEHPATLAELFSLVTNLRRRERVETASFILRHFFTVSEALLGSQHPLSRICEWFHTINECDFQDIVIRCVEVVVGQFERSVGSLHIDTLYSRIDLIRHITQKGEDGIQMFQRLLDECEETLRPDDLRMLMIREWTANDYFYGDHFDKAITLLQKNIAYSQDLSSTNTCEHELSWNFFMLARCQYALNDTDLGIATLHQAIDLAITRWSPQAARVREWLLYLEDWYSEQGLWDSAAQTRERRNTIQASIVAD